MSDTNNMLANAEGPVNDARQSQPADQEVMAFVTLETLRTLLQGAGYRAEVVTDGNISFLRSASNGLDFDLRPGNVFVKEPADASDKPARFADLVFVVVFTVQGTFPTELLTRWNQTHRFGRLFLDKTHPEREFLALTFDVSVVGGVTPAYLRHELAIWDSLVQQVVPWLREELGKVASTVNTQSTASSQQVLPSQPANA